MTENTQIVDFDTETVINIDNPEFQRSTDYPSAKFTNADSKPTMKIHGVKESDMEYLRSATYAFLSGNKIAPAVITHYMYELMNTIITAELTEPWTSYTITIPVGKIKPLDLVHATLSAEAEKIPVVAPIPFGVEDDEYLLLLLMSWYRYAHAHDKHKETISGRGSALLAQAKRETTWSDKLSTSNTNLIHLQGNAVLDFLTSCLDMFLEKFPAHQFAKARFKSIITRYQGCSGYANLAYMGKLLGVEQISYCTEWFFAAQIKNEITQMVVKQKEEWTVKNSYLPYMMCMRLSEKSPFSATNNPILHFLIHTVGTLLGSPRSQNAIMVEGVDIPIIVNAVIIFLAHKQNVDLRVIYMNKKDKLALKEVLKKRSQDNDDDSKLDTPYKWLEFYRMKDFSFAPEDIKCIELALERIQDVREKTVGEWLVNITEKRSEIYMAR
uniref:Nucleoprotein n=1 Tax=Entomophthora narnavirus F TaxID=2592754 RepID=A0A7G3W8U4_9VIRU|nr:putative CP [Entomophthora narnavirus F]